MKNLLILLLICFMGLGLNAQSELNTEKTEKTVSKIKKIDSRDRLIMEFNHNNWVNKPDGLETKWYNRGFNFFLMYDLAIGKSKKVSFAPGLGISTNNVYHNSDILTDENGVTYFQPINKDIRDWKTNKLATTYIELPVELRFRTTPNKHNKSFKVGLGFRLGYMLQGNWKYRGDRIDDEGNTYSVKVKDLRVPNINRLKYGPSIRIGYGDISLVASYSLSALFKKDKGPQIRMLSVGVSFNSF